MESPLLREVAGDPGRAGADSTEHKGILARFFTEECAAPAYTNVIFSSPQGWSLKSW
jgi:hypothetical protein